MEIRLGLVMIAYQVLQTLLNWTSFFDGSLQKMFCRSSVGKSESDVDLVLVSSLFSLSWNWKKILRDDRYLSKSVMILYDEVFS